VIHTTTKTIPMEGVRRVLSNDSHWDAVVEAPNLKPFSSETIDFVSDLAMAILGNQDIRPFPQLMALGFWLRRANLVSVIRKFESLGSDSVIKLPRGLAFHVAPSNVDTIFVYSWILSMLCGNRNIVRLSSKTSFQLELLLKLIDRILADSKYESLRRSLSLVRYESSSSASSQFSSICDVRVIWGGDATVDTIRQTRIPPTAIDIAFANKWSMSIIDCDYWQILNEDGKKKLARDFTYDAFQFGQAACSSPRCVVWRNPDKTEFSTNYFWDLVRGFVADIYTPTDIDAVNKLVTIDRWAAVGRVKVIQDEDNTVTRADFDIQDLPFFAEWLDVCDGGLFVETVISDLGRLFQRMGRKLQTISCAGVNGEEWKALLEAENLSCIDRIVPIGKALDFSVEWDGYQLLEVFLRRVNIAV
jgi:hypothetical protein